MSYQTWSRPLDVHRVSDFQGVNDVAAALTTEIVELRKAHGKRVREPKALFEHVRTLALDLYVASMERAPAERRPVPRWVGISRAKGAYQKSESRYGKLFLAYRYTVPTLDDLISLGYVKQVEGFHDPRTGIGRVTRIRARKKLMDLFQAYKVTGQEIRTGYKGELIVLRDEAGNDIDYEDTPQTIQWRANLERINAAIGKLRIRLRITDDDLYELNRRMAGNPERGAIDYRRTALRRIFNNGSWEQGGRFYDGWWQGVPREYRKYIYIEHKHSVEADYSGLHIRMLYAIEGLTPPDDPYDISGIDRDLQKQCVLVMINAESRDSAFRAIRREVPKGTAVLQVMEAIFERHAPVGKYFYSGIGLYLQYRDSCIAEKVMLRMLDKGRTVLPMHDSFIMRDSLVKELEEEMNLAFEEEFPGTKARIKLKTTSYQEEEKRKYEENGEDDVDEKYFVNMDLKAHFEERKKYSKFYE